MAADRRIDAARGFRQFGKQRRIKRFAHAVQALELVTVDAAGILDHAGDGERIMGGELRKDARARGEKLLAQAM